MSLCALCAVVLVNDTNLCPYHPRGTAKNNDWAEGSRVMCGFPHHRTLHPVLELTGHGPVDEPCEIGPPE